MPYQVRSITKNFPKHCFVEDAFSPDEVEKIIALEDLQKFKKGVVGRKDDEPIYSTKDRDSKIQWLEPNPSTEWLFNKLSDLIPKVNYDFFMHCITQMEHLQYTIYEKDQHYDWHIDSWDDQIIPMTRKISYSVLLSNPDEYEGGELEIVPFGMFHKSILVKPKAGSVVFFDSLFPHKVHPVKNGTRKTLVSWVMGPVNVKFY